MFILKNPCLLKNKLLCFLDFFFLVISVLEHNIISVTILSTLTCIFLRKERYVSSSEPSYVQYKFYAHTLLPVFLQRLYSYILNVHNKCLITINIRVLLCSFGLPFASETCGGLYKKAYFSESHE